MIASHTGSKHSMCFGSQDDDTDGSQGDVIRRTVWDDWQSGSKDDEDTVPKMKAANEFFHIARKHTKAIFLNQSIQDFQHVCETK